MQPKKRNDLQKRSRYYQSLMDTCILSNPGVRKFLDVHWRMGATRIFLNIKGKNREEPRGGKRVLRRAWLKVCVSRRFLL